jgi:hypothetical protein
MTKLIGINGYKRSGKGETGNAIRSVASDHFHSTTLVGFADKLKILAAKTLGFTDRSDEECIALMDECKEKWTFDITAQTSTSLLVPDHTVGFWNTATHALTGREFLQNLGNEARKVFGEDFWADQVLPKPNWNNPGDNRMALEGRYGTDYVAFTDLRYENEAQRVLDLGGEVWEVLRPDTDSDGHASEKKLPRGLVTRQIHNSSDLMNLRWQVEKALGY